MKKELGACIAPRSTAAPSPLAPAPRRRVGGLVGREHCNSPRLAYTGKTGELLTEEQLATSTLLISHGSGEVE